MRGKENPASDGNSQLVVPTLVPVRLLRENFFRPNLLTPHPLPLTPYFFSPSTR